MIKKNTEINRPIVSFIIFYTENFLSSLSNLLDQNVPSWELFVVVSNNNKIQPNELKELEKVPHLTMIYAPNESLFAACYKKIIHQAQGKFVYLFYPNVSLAKNFVRSIEKTWEDQKDLDLIEFYSNGKVNVKESKLVSYQELPVWKYFRHTSERAIALDFLRKNQIISNNNYFALKIDVQIFALDPKIYLLNESLVDLSASMQPLFSPREMLNQVDQLLNNCEESNSWEAKNIDLIHYICIETVVFRYLATAFYFYKNKKSLEKLSFNYAYRLLETRLTNWRDNPILVKKMKLYPTCPMFEIPKKHLFKYSLLKIFYSAKKLYIHFWDYAWDK